MVLVMAEKLVDLDENIFANEKSDNNIIKEQDNNTKNEEQNKKTASKGGGFIRLGLGSSGKTSGDQGGSGKPPSFSRPVTNEDLYNKMEELVDTMQKLIKLIYAHYSLLHKELFMVIEELDDPILSKLSPKAKEVMAYLFEESSRKKMIPTISILAKFNLTQDELFQIVDEINKVIQQYGLSIRFIELESEEEF